MKCTLSIVGSFSALLLSAQPPSSFPTDYATAMSRLSAQLSVYPQEKLYVHTDRDFYEAGDTLWLRVHSVDAGSHRAVCGSRYVYAELHPSSPPDRGDAPGPLRIRIRERDGVYAGYLALPAHVRSGWYTLTAYTHFMRNAGPDYFYRKQLHVASYGRPSAARTENGPSGAFEVSFYPEGGYLVSDRRCCVGFQALREDGRAVAVRGQVVDETGSHAVSLESVHAGLGKFYFTPEAGRTYYAECRDPQTGERRRFRLPQARSDVCALQVYPASERFTVDVCCGADFAPPELYLLIHCRGTPYYYGAWKHRALSFERKDFPDGVLQVLLLDGTGRALSERLLLCYDPGRQPRIAIAPDKTACGRREKVRLTLSCRDPEGRPLSGSVSISVTDNRMVDPRRPSDIRTSLLLESELRGPIEDPAFYFDAAHPENLAQADALMLTQGWRRYDIPAALRGKYAYPSEPLEIGQQITGRLRKTGLFRKRNFKGYKVDMLAPRQGVFATAEVDSAGYFTLDGFELPDSTLCVLQASGKDGRQDVELLVDSVRFPACGSIPAPGPTKYPLHDYSRLGPLADSIVPIPEVVIRAKIPRTPTTPFEALASRSVDYTKIEKENYVDMEEALMLTPGVMMRNGWPYIMGLPAVFIVNGIIESGMEEIVKPGSSYNSLSHNAPKWSTKRYNAYRDYESTFSDEAEIRRSQSSDKKPFMQYDYNHMIPIELVKRIDIIPPVNTVLFGSRVGSKASAICITTRDGSELVGRKHNDSERLNFRVVHPIGYQKPAEFYSPTYAAEDGKQTPERDLRTTLYWNPDVRIAPEGHASVEFYSGDKLSDYQIEVVGNIDRNPLLSILNFQTIQL